MRNLVDDYLRRNVGPSHVEVELEGEFTSAASLGTANGSPRRKVSPLKTDLDPGIFVSGNEIHHHFHIRSFVARLAFGQSGIGGHDNLTVALAGSDDLGL